MSRWKVMIPAVIALGGLLVCASASFGNTDAAKATKQKCVYCHEKVSADKAVMKGNLTAAGKYFSEHKSLDGYQGK